MPGQQGDLFDYDAELRRHHEHLGAAIDVGPADRVPDIGCGTGQTTREAARAAVLGSALGIDVSAPRLARARRLSHREGLRKLQRVFGSRREGESLPVPLADLVASPQDGDALARSTGGAQGAGG